MKKQSEDLRKKLIGLGEDSARKSYYPELQSKIRQLEESRQSLIDSYNQRRDFMRNILHELRTPLHGLGGILRVFRGELLTEHQIRLLDDMVQTLKRLENLVGEVQSIADEGITDLDRYGELKLNSVLENIASPIISKAAVDGDFTIKVVSEIPAGLQGKVALFQLGLTQFLNASFRFEKLAKPVLEVKVKRETMDSIDLLFELSFASGELTENQKKRFYSLLQESSRSYEGDKLEFVEAGKLFCFGGLASVESLRPAVFSLIHKFDIVSLEMRESASRPAESFAQNEGNTTNVLLVEDNEINLSAMELILEDKPCNVFSAHNGKEAFDLFQLHSFALIFMDMKMPIMGGEEAITLIREFEEKNHRQRTPIIAITAFAMTGDRERIIELGADDYLAKPFDFAYFENLVDQFVGHAPLDVKK